MGWDRGNIYMKKELAPGIIQKIVDEPGFFEQLLFHDTTSDWNVVREFAEFTIEKVPEDLGVHLMLVKAHRHLGNQGLAAAEIAVCRALVASGEGLSVIEPFLEVMEQEALLIGDC
jgi:hypothetical protein